MKTLIISKVDDFSDYLNDKIINLFKDEKIDWVQEKKFLRRRSMLYMKRCKMRLLSLFHRRE